MGSQAVGYHSMEAADRETAQYLRAVRAIGKGREKKVNRACEDLAARVSDPDQVMLRRLWWGRRTWEQLLSGLTEGASAGPPPVGELLLAYSEAWSTIQSDWDRWHDRLRPLRDELRSWLLAAGRRPVAVDLHATKPAKEIRRAEEEFRRQPTSRDRSEPMPVQLRLARALDYTVMFDVEWGSSFENPVDQRIVTWPWERRWPHEFDGMGEWCTRSGEPLIGTVIRLLDGGGTIRTGQTLFSQAPTAGGLMDTSVDTQVIVCDERLLLMQWGGLGGPMTGNWCWVDAHPYDRVEFRRLRRVETAQVIDPETGKPVFTLLLKHMDPIVAEALREAKGASGHSG